MREDQVCAYLKGRCTGKHRAIKAARLGQSLRIGEKELQKVVAKLRRKGVPIASGPTGYYYAAIRQLKEMERASSPPFSGWRARWSGLESGVIRPEQLYELGGR